MVHDGPLCAASIRCRQTIRSSNKSARLGLTASWQQSPHETRQGNCSTIRGSQDSRAVLGPESTKQGDAMATGFSPLRCFLVLSRPQPPVAPRELAISEWKPPKPSGPCEIHDPLSLPAGPKSCGTGRSPRTIDKLRPSGVRPSDGVHREGLKIHIEMVAPSPPDGCIAATAHKSHHQPVRGHLPPSVRLSPTETRWLPGPWHDHPSQITLTAAPWQDSLLQLFPSREKSGTAPLLPWSWSWSRTPEIVRAAGSTVLALAVGTSCMDS